MIKMEKLGVEQIYAIIDDNEYKILMINVSLSEIDKWKPYGFKESILNRLVTDKLSKLQLIDLIPKIFENPDEVFDIHAFQIFGTKYEKTKVILTREDAVLPSKSSPSDSGFDLTLIDIAKKIGKVTLYNTGVKVQPPFGMYFDMVPRSSVIKSGYMLANSVGIIDQGYTGEIMVPLIKIDPDAPDLQLPNRLVQLIPRKWHHMQIENVTELENTTRSEGGFGSTG